MKRLIATGLVLLTLVFMLSASAAAPGSIADPLITRSYLEGAFADLLMEEIKQTLNGETDKALSRLDLLYSSHERFSFAPRFTPVSLSAVDTITMSMGASFVLLSGTATLTVTSGEVINISNGSVAVSGSKLTLNERYFCAENTTAVVAADSASTGHIDGYFYINSENRSHSIFTDVMRSDWFFHAVDFAYENRLFLGTGATVFSPDVNMNRAMFVTVLHRLEGQPESGTESIFSDVSDLSSYYYGAVVWAVENNITSGFGDGTFRPYTDITREQMAMLIYRYALHKGRDMPAFDSAFDAFSDTENVSDYAEDAVRRVVSAGIISGSEGRLLPMDAATRAQVAQIFYNFLRD